MEGFKVGTPEMRRAAQELSQGRDEMTQQSNQLRSECEQIKPAWQGPAGTAFQTLTIRYDEDFKKLLQALADIEEQLLGAAADVDAQQSAANENISRISNALGG